MMPLAVVKGETSGMSSSNRIIILLVSTLTLQVYSKQAANTRGLVSRQNLPDKNIRLDPLLRRALLRALTELEKEAQEKVKEEEEVRNPRSEPENGNFLRELQQREEIQNTADSNYPSPTPNNLRLSTQEEVSTIRFNENVESTSPATIQDSFLFRTPSTVDESDSTSVQNVNAVQPTNPSDIVSNLIPQDANEKVKESTETTEKVEEVNAEKREEGGNPKEANKSSADNHEVDIFKAPLVAAFTLHQDSKGTPHSVIPLFRKDPQDSQRQQLLEQQYALFKQQQQQQQQQQFIQNQFIPSVTINPLSQPNQFDQPGRFFASPNIATNFVSSTVFPPLVSNSILPQNFPSSVIPPQTFQQSTTAAPFRSNQAFLSTLAPQRNLSPQPFPTTLLPPQDFSIVQSHNLNFSPTPQPSFPTPTVAPPQGFQPISIPPVTLPLQNEPRFQSPIIVPSLQVNTNQAFLQNQEQQRLRNQFLIEEQNRQRLIEEQNRQRQIEEQNRQRQIEEQNRQRQIEEQNRQRQRQLEEQNRLRQLEEERQKQILQQNLRQQRQEQGVDFQRSVGFSFNQNTQSNFNKPLQVPGNAFNFQIQPSQSFIPPLNFHNVETRNRVNRQEGFGSTGNLGVNQQGQRNFGAFQNQFQSNHIFPPFPNPPAYRTIPDEHYRNLQINQLQQGNRFVQFRQQPNFQQNVQDVNKQLQKLLYQSGVATDASGQEDLNIVSKVLALNHERSDTNAEGTLIRNERRAVDSEKSLGVGEIKDIEVTTEFLEAH